jgi:hypothetical protein
MENNNFIYFVKIGTVWRIESLFKKSMSQNATQEICRKLVDEITLSHKKTQQDKFFKLSNIFLRTHKRMKSDESG